jgi:hypothetical protein
MIRVDFSSAPKRWHTVELPDENGEPQEAKIQYKLLDKVTVTGYRRADIELAKSGALFRSSAREDDPSIEQAFLSELVERMDESELTARTDLLRSHIAGWDFEGADGNPLPCTDEIKSALLNRADWFAPIWQGLLDASEGAGKKLGRNG